MLADDQENATGRSRGRTLPFLSAVGRPRDGALLPRTQASVRVAIRPTNAPPSLAIAGVFAALNSHPFIARGPRHAAASAARARPLQGRSVHQRHRPLPLRAGAGAGDAGSAARAKIRGKSRVSADFLLREHHLGAPQDARAGRGRDLGPALRQAHVLQQHHRHDRGGRRHRPRASLRGGQDGRDRRPQPPVAEAQGHAALRARALPARLRLVLQGRRRRLRGHGEPAPVSAQARDPAGLSERAHADGPPIQLDPGARELLRCGRLARGHLEVQMGALGVQLWRTRRALACGQAQGRVLHEPQQRQLLVRAVSLPHRWGAVETGIGCARQRGLPLHQPAADVPSRADTVLVSSWRRRAGCHCVQREVRARYRRRRHGVPGPGTEEARPIEEPAVTQAPGQAEGVANAES
ncbi:hypothetical protein ON010_g4337 [Phytophthora cinnamomi]|nr:hypothetical protein ON010_g4337 [Phytophthora cinnamomi]